MSVSSSDPPYTPPSKPLDDFTSEERKAWLANHFATAPERQKQSDRFRMTAVICLGTALLVPILAILLAMIFK